MRHEYYDYVGKVRNKNEVYKICISNMHKYWSVLLTWFFE